MTREEYLQHHGILGQKWGHKAGPPYPLDASDHTAAEKKAGWRESITENRERKFEKRNEHELKKMEHELKKNELALKNKELEIRKLSLKKQEEELKKRESLESKTLRELEFKKRKKELKKANESEAVQKGKSVVSHVLTNSLKDAGVKVLSAVLIYEGKNIVERSLGKEARRVMFNEEKKAKTVIVDTFEQTLKDGTHRKKTTTSTL